MAAAEPFRGGDTAMATTPRFTGYPAESTTSAELPALDLTTELRDYVRGWLDRALEAGHDFGTAIAAIENAAWAEARTLQDADSQWAVGA
jgi:hypothetical protein